ncbi:MAG: hypothetical protein JNJ98_02885 [Gemmatimonadetes bacterium]|nr:hypothetical protein [Gemmatimonadota bacterium]
MKRVPFLMIVAMAASRLLEAQGATIDTQCRGATATQRASQDACQKALDLFQYMAPQLAGAITGGNAALGEHSSRGGAGRFSVGVRVNAVRGRLPNVEAITPSINGAVVSDYTPKEQLLPVPVVDAALGVFPGVYIGGTQALAVDALLNLAYLPSVNETDVQLSLPDGSVKVGFGARVSVVQETSFSPGISVTWLQRNLPRLDLVATPGSDQLNVNDFLAKTTAWRAVIGKNLGFLALSAGFGQDETEVSAVADVRVVRSGVTYSAGPIAAIQSLTRDNAFGSVALRLPVFSLIGEYGRVSGGQIATYNTFGTTRADDALEYASVGIRLRF